MTIQGVFEAALLKYIQAEVDQLAEGIYDCEQYRGNCNCGPDDWTCMCDTSTSLIVFYNVPLEINRFGRQNWRYEGDFFELIRMLDRIDSE